MFYAPLLALAASATGVSAVTKGFNYGATNSDGSPKTESQFASEFSTCSKLAGTTGFADARLYTTIQAGTTSDVSGAIPAAVNSGTHVMLGVWGSGPSATVDDEITALKAAASQYPKLAGLCEGISVGSEDLYRNSQLGVMNKAGLGQDPDVIAGYIKKVKDALQGGPLASCPVGHVDTWTAWVNSTNDPVIQASDFIGMDAYPYFQSTMPNDITKGKALFQSAYSQTQAASGGKPIIVTEAGWPVSGPLSGQAVASPANAKTFWDEVGCDLLFDKVPTYWFTCQDATPTVPSPSFGVAGSDGKPLFDLSCKNVTSSSSSATGSATASATGSATGFSTGTSAASPTGGAGGSGSGANGTFTSALPSGSAGATATGAAPSHAGAAQLVPIGGLFAGALALAAAL